MAASTTTRRNVIDRNTAQSLLLQGNDWRLVDASECHCIVVGRMAWHSPTLGDISLNWDADGRYVWDAPLPAGPMMVPNCIDDFAVLMV